MGDFLSTYSIHFKGLKVGKHQFDFEIDNRFFELFEESEIKQGKLTAGIKLEKHAQLLDLKINIKGYVEVMCDRCLENFNLPLSYKGTLLVKFGEGAPDASEEIIFLPTEESELNIAHYLYESISLSIPYQRYHGVNGTDDKACNSEMLNKLKNLSGTASKTKKTIESDPRWDKLKDLKLN